MKKLSWLILLLGLIGSFAYAEFREEGGKGINFSAQTTIPADTYDTLYRDGNKLYFGTIMISSGD